MLILALIIRKNYENDVFTDLIYKNKGNKTNATLLYLSFLTVWCTFKNYMQNDVVYSFHEVVTIFYLFKKYLCKHRPIFDLLL